MLLAHKTAGLRSACFRPKIIRADIKTMGMFGSLFGGAEKGCQLAPKEPADKSMKLATFAGGCFWGLELAYQRVPGVENPTYNAVCMGVTGHTEAIQCTYNPSEVKYEELLDVFFGRVDPTTLNKQGNDSGTQYRSGIYYHDDEQYKIASKRIEEVNSKLASGEFGSKWRGKKVVSELKPTGDYYVAEDYHQQYLEKGGRGGRGQSAAKGATETIRCGASLQFWMHVLLKHRIKHEIANRD
eukprot:gene7713-881_t